MGRSDWLLVLGMAAGAAAVAAGLVGPASSSRIPDGAVASVGGRPITLQAYETALGLVERDRGAPATDEEKKHVLRRLVDEELLLQKGLALGLERSDRRVRSDLVSSVIDAVTSRADLETPTLDEQRAFFDANRSLFADPVSLRVAQVFVADAAAARNSPAERAQAAAARLRRGDDIASVRRDLGDLPPVEIPSSFQPATRFRDWIGASAASVIQSMAEGEISDPVHGQDGSRVMVVLERRGGSAATFDEKQVQVLAEWRRRRGERALDEVLEELRAHTETIFAPGLRGDDR